MARKTETRPTSPNFPVQLTARAADHVTRVLEPVCDWSDHPQSPTESRDQGSSYCLEALRIQFKPVPSGLQSECRLCGRGLANCNYQELPGWSGQGDEPWTTLHC